MITYIYNGSIINLEVMAVIDKGHENYGEKMPAIIFKTNTGYIFHCAFSSVIERDDEFDKIIFLLQFSD